jgi:hypothetical protein
MMPPVIFLREIDEIDFGISNKSMTKPKLPPRSSLNSVDANFHAS